jgi:hypothetical protein
MYAMHCQSILNKRMVGNTWAAAIDGSLRIAWVALIPRAMSWNTYC